MSSVELSCFTASSVKAAALLRVSSARDAFSAATIVCRVWTRSASRTSSDPVAFRVFKAMARPVSSCTVCFEPVEFSKLVTAPFHVLHADLANGLTVTRAVASAEAPNASATWAKTRYVCSAAPSP